MMWRVLFIIAAFFLWLPPAEPSPSSAGAGKFAAAAPNCTGGFQGAGDVKSGAVVWGGLRAYNCATAGQAAANICNSGDANCADVNSLLSGDFDATTAQGSPLNCGGAGGTCTVKKLYNKGTAGSSFDLAMSTIANRPTLVFGCSNGKACMKGSFTAQIISSGSLGQAQPWSIFVAVNNDNSTSNYAVALGDAENGVTRNNSNNIAACFTSGTLTKSMTDSAWHREACVANGGSSALYVDNDGSPTTGSLGTTALNFQIVMFGNTFGQNNLGFIEEGGIWPVALSSTDVGNLDLNLKTYLGL